MKNELEFKKIGFELEKIKRNKKITNEEISVGLGVTEQAVQKVIGKLKKGKNCSLETVINIFSILEEDFLKYKF